MEMAADKALWDWARLGPKVFPQIYELATMLDMKLL